MSKIKYKACSWNSEGKPCLGDLVKEGKVEKEYYYESYEDDVTWQWVNVSNETFLVYVRESEDVCFEFVPGQYF